MFPDFFGDVAHKVGDGINIPWHAFARPDDTEAQSIAELLASFCQERGGLVAPTLTQEN